MKYRITDGKWIDEVIDTFSDVEASEKLRNTIYEQYGVNAFTETYCVDGAIYRLAEDGKWELVDLPKYVYRKSKNRTRRPSQDDDWRRDPWTDPWEWGE